MLKWSAILATSVFLTISVSGQSNKNPAPDPEPPKQKQPALHPANGEQSQGDTRDDKGKPNSVPQSRDTSIKRPQWMWDSNWWLVIIAGLTGCVIGWQSWETRRAAKATQESVKAVVEQTKLLNDSVVAAQKSADAADISAQAGSEQIQMMKSKERARISVSISDGKLEVGPDDFDAIIIKIGNYGPTSAHNVTAIGQAMGQPGEQLPYLGAMMNLNIPSVLWPDIEPTTVEVVFVNRHDLRELGPSSPPYFFHVSGTIKYQDVFGEEHTTTSRHRLQVLGVRTSSEGKRVQVRSLYGWRKCGSAEENQAS